jgi:hypothetical protein
MGSRLKIAAIATALAAGTSGAAMAQAVCPPGSMFYNGVCQTSAAAAPAAPVGPLSGAAAGGAAGAASGNAAVGPVGGIVGGALGTATGAVTGTANMVTGVAAPAFAAPPPAFAAAPPAPVPDCGPGRVFYMNACYPDLTGFYTSMRATGYAPGS